MAEATRELTEAQLYAPDLDEGELDVEHYRLPDVDPTADKYVQSVWRAVMEYFDENLAVTANVFCATGPGGGIDPTCGKGDAGFPHPSKVKVIKDLPGSTGPKLVEDENGKKWVMKTGPSKDALVNEVSADAAYRAMGVKTPKSGLVDGVKFSEFMEGGVELGKWREGKSHTEIQAMHAKIGKHFVADAVLANWDSVGTGANNILIIGDEPYRIDNGGALKYRAKGGLKGAAFGPHVGELTSLKDDYLNPDAAKVFKDVGILDIAKQKVDVYAKKAEVLAAIADPETKKMLEMRLNSLGPGPMGWTAKKGFGAKSDPDEPVSSGFGPKFDEFGNPKGPHEPWQVTTKPSLNKPGFVAKTALAGVKHAELTKGVLTKIDIVNPHGPEGGILKVPSGLSYGAIQAIQKHLNVATTKVKTAGLLKGKNKAEVAKALGIGWAGVADAPGGYGGPAKKAGKAKMAGKGKNVTAPNPVLAEQHAKVQLLKAEQQAITHYTGYGYAKINEVMRAVAPNFEKMTGETGEKATHILNAIGNAPKFSEPVLVKRGMYIASKGVKEKFIADVTEAAKTNKPFQFPSITSTSASSGFDGNIRFQIKAKTGLYIKPWSSHPSENEVILSPMTQYKIIKTEVVESKYGSGSTFHVHLEEA